jgi:putative phosphoribosyl transferase
MHLFKDRAEAGRRLVESIPELSPHEKPLVLALPRGGVPVAREIADAVGLALDVFVIRRLEVPGREDVAMGAIASGGIRVLNQDVVDSLEISESLIARVAAQEQRQLQRMEMLYRGGKPDLDLDGRTVILVDDGIATGASMRAAMAAVGTRQPAALIVAVPMAPAIACRAMAELADQLVCVACALEFRSVGAWYGNFDPVLDDDVIRLLGGSKPKSSERPLPP